MKTILLSFALMFLLVITLAAQQRSISEDAKLFAEGYSIFLEGNCTNALSKFEELEKLYPKSNLIDRVIFWKAWCHVELKNYGVAIKTFESLIQKFPRSSYADDALFKIGEIYESHLHDYDNAVKTYERIIKLFPVSNPELMNNVSNTAVNAQQQIAQINEEVYRNIPQALNDWEKSQALNSQISTYRNKPGSYFNMKAQERINFIKTNNDNDYVPLTKLIEGEVLIRDNKYQQAIEKFQEIIKEFPQSSLADNATFESALCLKKQNKSEEAKAAFRKFLQVYPKSELIPSAQQELK